MAFFLIVPSVMIVSIILVHSLANRLGLRIYYTTLVAVAVLSFMVLFAAVLVSPAIGREYLLRLGLLILVASVLVTLANNFLLNKQRDEEKRFTEEVKAAYAAEIHKDSTLTEESPASLDNFSAENSNEAFNTVGRYNEIHDESDAQPFSADAADTSDAKADIKNFSADSSDELEQKISEAAGDSAPKKFPLAEVFKPLPEVKPEEADQVIKLPDKTKPTEFFPLQEVFEPLSVLRLDKIEELTNDEKTSPHEIDSDSDEIDTLDDILDKAYNERTKGHVWQAIELYKKALERYRNDEYAPFVVIDLGNIYKEQALYSKAIKIYEDALTLSPVKRNSSIRKEFAANLVYLRVVHNVLLKHHALSTPFGQVSKEILQEIDSEFQTAQIHSQSK